MRTVNLKDLDPILNLDLLIKLQTASPRVQKYYHNIRNIMNDYPELKFKASTSAIMYSYKQLLTFKCMVSQKALKLYFALDPLELSKTQLQFTNLNDGDNEEALPVLVEVNNDKTYHNALLVIEELVKKLDLQKEEVAEINYLEALKTTSKNILIAHGYINILKDSCSISECDNIDRSLANKCVLYALKEKTKEKKNVFEISIGELSAAFSEKYVIDLDLLKRVGIAPMDANYLYVNPKNTCYKAITIKADDFAPEVIQMVVITGGTIIKLIN